MRKKFAVLPIFLLSLFYLPVFCTTSLYAQTWQMIAPMNVLRAEPGLVQLSNGLILAAGGADNQDALSSCEVYDPRTDSWRMTGSMRQKRYRHEIVALNDGRVMVAGGLTDPGTTTTETTEIYDPSTEKWIDGPPLTEPKQNFDHVTLPNGKVVFAGGLNSNAGANTFSKNCEVFDPATNTMTAFPQMLIGLYATNIFYSRSLDALVVPGGVFGGANGYYIRSTQLFDLKTNQWQLTDSMLSPQASSNGQSVQLSNDLITFLSARNAQYTNTDLVESFDYATMQWKKIGSLDHPRFLAKSFVVNEDSVLVIGGVADPDVYRQPLDNCTWFNVKTGVSSPGPTLNFARFSHRAVHYRLVPEGRPCDAVDRIYVFGGRGNNGSLAQCEVLDVGTFSAINPVALDIPSLTIGPSCAGLDTMIHLRTGPCSSMQLQRVLCLDSNNYRVSVDRSLPVFMVSSSQDSFALHIEAIGKQLAGTTVVLDFRDAAGHTVERTITIPASANRSTLELPTSIAVTVHSCNPIDTTIRILNFGCDSVTLFRASLPLGEDSGVYLRTNLDTSLTGLGISAMQGGAVQLHVLSTRNTPLTTLLQLRLIRGGVEEDTTIPLTIYSSNNAAIVHTIIKDNTDIIPGDTLRVPIYLTNIGSATFSDLHVDLSYNTDMFHLVKVEMPPPATPYDTIYDIQSHTGGASVYFPWNRYYLDTQPVMVLDFTTYISTEVCSAIRINDFSFTDSSTNSCGVVVEQDSAMICFNWQCADGALYSFMHTGKLPSIDIRGTGDLASISGTIENLSVQGRLEVIDLLGHQVTNLIVSAAQPQFRLPMAGWSTGPYILVLTTPSSTVSKKVFYRR